MKNIVFGDKDINIPSIEEIVNSLDLEKIKDPKWGEGFFKYGGFLGKNDRKPVKTKSGIK